MHDSRRRRRRRGEAGRDGGGGDFFIIKSHHCLSPRFAFTQKSNLYLFRSVPFVGPTVFFGRNRKMFFSKAASLSRYCCVHVVALDFASVLNSAQYVSIEVYCRWLLIGR